MRARQEPSLRVVTTVTGARPDPLARSADTGDVPKRILIVAAVAVVAAVAAFAALDVVLAVGVAILGLTVVALVAAATDWEQHPTFEQRELERARRRAAKRERTAPARARDRAKWEAHQARKQAQQGGHHSS